MILYFLKLIVSLLLIAFSLFQLNDSDGFIWAGIYLLPILLLFRKKPSLRVNIAISILYFCSAVILWPPEYHGLASMNEQPEIEQARESLGVLIAAILLCVTTIIDNRYSNQ